MIFDQLARMFYSGISLLINVVFYPMSSDFALVMDIAYQILFILTDAALVQLTVKPVVVALPSCTPCTLFGSLPDVEQVVYMAALEQSS